MSMTDYVPWFVFVPLFIIVGCVVYYIYLMLFKPEQWFQHMVKRYRWWGIEATIVDKERFQKASRLCAIGPLIAIGMIAFNVVNLYNNRTFGRALCIAGYGQDIEARGDLQGAIKKYEEAVKKNSNSAYLLALLGNAYHEAGEDQKALMAYKIALQRSPRHFWVHYLLGELYRDEHLYNDAIKEFKDLTVMQDNWYGSNKIFHYTQYQDLAWGQLGYCYAKIGARQESIAAYQEYLIKNPSAEDRKVVEAYIRG